MAQNRPFSYYTGPTASGSTKVGNIMIGEPTAGFTSVNTDWWGGADESLGYVVCLVGPRSTPIGVTANIGFKRSTNLTEESFIQLVNSISESTFYSGFEARDWLTANGYWTSYEGVITSGLSLHLDVQHPLSYGGTGTTWYGLTANNRDATLINTPTYNGSSPYNFGFDRNTFEYATIPNIGNLSNFTVEAWFKLTTIPVSASPRATSIISNEFNGTVLNFSIGTNNAPTDYNIGIGFFNGAWFRTTGFTPLNNTWYHVVGTYNGSVLNLYRNGDLFSSANHSATPISGGNIRIARRWDDADNVPGNFFPGNISIIRIYNTALSGSQVVQNYNAQKSRFGL